MKVTKRTRKYITRKKNRYKVRMRFINSDGSTSEMVIPDTRKFIDTPMVKIGDNQWALQEDEPVQSGRDYIYTVKLVEQSKTEQIWN